MRSSTSSFPSIATACVCWMTGTASVSARRRVVRRTSTVSSLHHDEIVTRDRRLELGTYTTTFAQLYLTAIIAGICRAIARDAVELVRHRGRTFSHATNESPVQDPLLQQVVGQLASNAFAADAIVTRAADALDAWPDQSSTVRPMRH